MIRESAAIGSWLLLACLAVLPGRYGDRRVEAARTLVTSIAFFGSAALTRFWLQETRSRLQILVFLTAAALFSLYGSRLPGRSPGLGGWAANAAGAIIGTMMVKWYLEGTLL